MEADMAREFKEYHKDYVISNSIYVQVMLCWPIGPCGSYMSQVTNKQVVTFQLCMAEMPSTQEKNKVWGSSAFINLSRTTFYLVYKFKSPEGGGVFLDNNNNNKNNTTTATYNNTTTHPCAPMPFTLFRSAHKWAGIPKKLT